MKAVGVRDELYTENPLRRNDNSYKQSPASFGNKEDLVTEASGSYGST